MNSLDRIHLLIYDFVYLGFVFQSDSASVKVPELELELSCGTLGGMVTTVEGLIVKICEGRSASLYSPPCLKGRTQCRELPLCAGSGEGCQWQALPSPVQCEETATRTRIGFNN